MQSFKKIYSIFFLSIFSLFMLHQLLPHVHHRHEGFGDSKHVEDHPHSHHEKGHHHDGEDCNDDFDLLGFLLGNHSHGIQTESIPSIKHVVNLQREMRKNINPDVLLKFLPVLSIDPGIPKSKFGKAPPDSFNKIFQSTSFLRGPPSLG